MARKRIVVCADGTWNDPEREHPTNVLRVARAVHPEDEDGVQQVVFYDWGVGSYYATLRGGVSGLGIAKNIQDCYRFIVQNHDQGDELFLLGFSRGAYTVRALAGLLNKCGILRREEANLIPEAFSFYKRARIKPGSPQAQKWREERSLERAHVHFVGVWDTVGALGIPTRVLAFVDQRDLFYDTKIGSNVRFARHAVSIDEKREDFWPTLWAAKESADIKQVWFAGVHADVGGGYPPSAGRVLSDVPLAWMAAEAAACGLALQRHLHGDTEDSWTAEKHESYKRFYKVLREKRHREIPVDGVVHHSVRQRHEAGGYQSRPLEEWLKRNGGWGAIEDAAQPS